MRRRASRSASRASTARCSASARSRASRSSHGEHHRGRQYPYGFASRQRRTAALVAVFTEQSRPGQVTEYSTASAFRARSFASWARRQSPHRLCAAGYGRSRTVP